MLAVNVDEEKLWGCPNCGCDTWVMDNFFRSDQVSGKCRHCGLHYQIVANGCKPEVRFGTGRKDSEGKDIMEAAILIKHPRIGIEAWHWELPDIKPDNGEYWSSRGLGYDLSGFVKSKQAGERLQQMVKEVLNKEEPLSYLDYRECEPTWIQFKFQKQEFNLEELERLAKENDNIVTIDILSNCRLIIDN